MVFRRDPSLPGADRTGSFALDITAAQRLSRERTFSTFQPEGLFNEMPAASLSCEPTKPLSIAHCTTSRRPAKFFGALIEEVRFAADSLLEERGFELVWGFSCQVVVLGFC